MIVDESYYDELHAVACRAQAAALDRIKGAGARVMRDAGFGPEMTADDRAVMQLDAAAQTVAAIISAQRANFILDDELDIALRDLAACAIVLSAVRRYTKTLNLKEKTNDATKDAPPF